MKLTVHLDRIQQLEKGGVDLSSHYMSCVHRDNFTFTLPSLFGQILHLIDDYTTDCNLKLLNHKTSTFIPIS